MRDKPYYGYKSTSGCRTVQFCTGRIAINQLVNKCSEFVSEIDGQPKIGHTDLPRWITLA